MGSFRRTDLPVALHGAADWSDSPVQTEDGLLDLLRTQPQIKKELLRRANPALLEGGRPRLPGQWPIAYLLFVASREPTIKRWLQRTDKRIWRRCGFISRPKYDTTHHHFAQLEEHAEDFRWAASELIALAVRQSGGLVGRDVHVDGTEAETNSRLFHDCHPGQCPRGIDRGKSPLSKAPTPLAQEERQRGAEQLPAGSSASEALEVQPLAEGAKRIKLSNGCWYRTSDRTAGVRVYAGPRGHGAKRFWLGFNNLKAVDHFTGAVLATWTVPADVNESSAYPHLLNQLIENTGQVPRAVVGDRGFSLGPVYETNTKLGIASVFPWRKVNQNEQRETVGTEHYDQHGIPRCKKCQGPGRFVRFQAGEKPRLWFDCQAGCGQGSVVCSRGWRYLLPLWRTEEAYLALRHSHSAYEKAHWNWRDRWLVGPDSVTNRPRRRGIACQQLRAQAALLLEWLIVCWREGWLGNRRQNTEKSFKNRARRQVERLLRYRERRGLTRPPVARARTG